LRYNLQLYQNWSVFYNFEEHIIILKMEYNFEGYILQTYFWWSNTTRSTTWLRSTSRQKKSNFFYKLWKKALHEEYPFLEGKNNIPFCPNFLCLRLVPNFWNSFLFHFSTNWSYKCSNSKVKHPAIGEGINIKCSSFTF
jgi:hypothetical protein